MRIMSRFIVAGILGLALAGCAQTRTNVEPNAPPPVPVALTPVPSIYESINRGTGTRSVQRTALKDTSDARWAGQAGGPLTRDPSATRAMASVTKPNRDSKPRVLATPGGADPIASAEALAESRAQAGSEPPRPIEPPPNASGVQAPVGGVGRPAPSEGEAEAVAGPAPVESPAPESATSPIISANGLQPVSELPAEDVGRVSHDPAPAQPATEDVGRVSPDPAPAQPAMPADPPAADPLLGPNPVLMPTPSMPAEEAKLAEPAAPAQPAEEPKVAGPQPATPAEPQAADPLLGPNPVLMPTPSMPAEEAKPADPQPKEAADPLLGPNPVLMPTPEPVSPVGTGGTPPAERSAPDEAPLPEAAPPESAATELVAPIVPAPEMSPAAPPPPSPTDGTGSGDPSPTEEEETPIVGTAKDENGEEFGLPPLPEAKPAPAAGSGDPRPTGAGDPRPAEPEEIPADTPIVGTAKDENGEEFGLPPLPEAKPAPGAGSGDPRPTGSGDSRPTGSGDPRPTEPAQSPGALETLPPLEAAPAESPAALNGQPAGNVALAQNRPPVDPGLRQASLAQAEVKTPEMAVSRNVKEAGRAAAGIGDEVITLNDLVGAVKEFRKKHPSQQPPSKDELNAMGKGILLMLIERSLLTQAVKHEVKNPKMIDQLMSYAEKSWTDDELPPLMRKYFAANVYELKEKMAAEHRSLDAIHESFKKDFLAQAFLHKKIGDKLKVELPEMLKYYQEHVNDRENQRPASITWREVLIEKDRYSSPQEARDKALKIVGRLRNGEDFAKLARTESDGPDLAKSQGGLMETTPGSYGVASVNQVIQTLPIGTVSEVLEGPTSLHIVVVEKRREAGPVTFAEIQDQIRNTIRAEKLQKERVALISKLRKQTVVWTIFDNTASDPNR
jgi:peptidyl-prolyl cis-trans isomerase SurA